MTLTLTPPSPTRPPLTPAQERIVEFGDGPLVVIAGAGTGKTRVIVERCRWLLETKGAGSRDADGRLLPAEPQPQPHPDHPFDGPLLPEQLLVLTYNVKAARELETRLDEAVGPATRARMTVSNFHSFCHRILSDSAGEAGMPPNPDVLDGVGQLLLLRDLQPALALVYHSEWQLQEIVSFINRAKDELVTPAGFDVFVAEERRVFEAQYGDYDAVAAQLLTGGRLDGPRKVRADYARIRVQERAEALGKTRRPTPPRPWRRRPTARPGAISTATGTPPHEATSRPRSRPRSTSWPPPTSATGRRWRSCGSRSSPPSIAPTRSRWSPGAPSISASRSPPRPSSSRRARTSCAAGSGSSATSWWTSSRTPTSPRSS